MAATSSGTGSPYALLWESKQKSPVSAVKFSFDGLVVAASGGSCTTELFEASTGRHLRSLEGHELGISDACWSADDALIATASDDCTVRLWDVTTGKQASAAFRGHLNFVFTIDFSPRGNIIASGSFDESLRLWDVRSGRSIRTIPAHSEPITTVQFNADGTLVATGSYDGLIRLWDVASGNCLTTLQLGDRVTFPPISCLRFTPNCRYLLASSLDGRLRLWDYLLGAPVKTYKGHDNHSMCVAATISAPSMPSAAVAAEMERAAAAAAASSGSEAAEPAQSGAGGASGGSRSSSVGGMALDIASSAAGKTRDAAEIGGHSSSSISSSISSSSSASGVASRDPLVVSGAEDGRVHAWHVNGRHQVTSWRAHSGPVLGLDAHPVSDAFVTGGGDGDNAVRVWRAA